MEKQKALEIIKALAEGIDPTTREVLSSDNVCNKGEVVRAFYTVINELEKNDKSHIPSKVGKPWTKVEEELLRELFETGLSRKEIAKRFERTAGSISSRLKKLGIIND